MPEHRDALLDMDPIAGPHTAHAFWIEAAGRGVLRPEALAPRGESEVLVRTLWSGISRGTESLVFKGLVPESEYERMRGPFMGGEFPFPVKYGYAAVGLVEEGPEPLIGRPVFALQPHQDLFIVAADMVRPLPDTVPARRAILAANMETALTILWDAGIQAGDRVAVFGAGVVGSLVAHLAARVPATQVRLIDRNPQRAALAAELGLSFSTTDRLEGSFDVLVNASAAEDALAQAIDHAGFEARIVEASWYGDRRVTIPLGGAFHSRRLQIVSSQVGGIPAGRRARWTYARRMTTALDLLADPRLDRLISGETDFAALPGTYAEILSASDTLCHAIRY
ncbi:zinc-dependent alcohol dehydrogenase [Rhizobium sp. YIM 134829]|uniref:zinc-dependent alcohol dehydrogenase n=1 Tax=Rhizobium sp. YIM 134829 TaxID=3390453 RepID=UPI00397AE339